MFLNQRHDQILELLEHEKEVSVAGLSKRFSVSEVTIRKDLIKLEKQGLLSRTFGGAVPVSEKKHISNSCFIPPETTTDYEKKAFIGQLAGNYIQDEDYIFLGPGYTCVEIAKNIKEKKRLTIMTMNISAAIELADIPENKLITVPGEFTRRNGTYYVTGALLYDYFSGYYFDKVFITMDGVSLSRGFTVLDESTAMIYHTLLKNTKEVIVCVNDNKFDKNAMAYLGPLTIADKIITNTALPSKYQQYFNEHGIQVIGG